MTMVDMAVFVRLQQVVAAMQAAGAAADWESFISLQQDYQQVLAILPPLTSVDISVEQRLLFKELLQKTQDSLNQVLPLAEQWKSHLASELAGIHNVGKLSRTYKL